MIPYERKERYTIDDLVEIVRLLRSEEGCPWDKEQTHKSIRSGLIEETYEVIEAIDQDDPVLLREELGDLLLQVVFHAQIEREQEHFTLDDVCTDICDKMIVRHPHVFSTVQADTTEQVLQNWDTIKEATKHQTTRTETLESVAKTLPALMRAQKVYKRASKARMPFLEEDALYDALERYTARIKAANANGDITALGEALGKLLFICTSIAQTGGIQSEQTLTDETNDFIRRFAAAETHCCDVGVSMDTLSEAKWNNITDITSQTEGV